MERLRVVSCAEELRPAELRRAVVFVFAAWSGPAVDAFRQFTRIVHDLAMDSVDIVVLDIDGLTLDAAQKVFGAKFRSGGWGETVWFRDGTVVALEIGRHTPDDVFRDHARSFLA